MLLPLFSLLPDVKLYPIFTHLLYIIVDLLCAEALYKISESREAVSSKLFTSPRQNTKISSEAVIAL
jgi:phosphatidylinositol glycan class U